MGWLSRAFGRARRRVGGGRTLGRDGGGRDGGGRDGGGRSGGRGGGRSGGRGGGRAAEDLAHLREFATTRRGVEFYLEPENDGFGTTLVAVAFDGEWTRRRVASPSAAGRLARSLGLPVYEAGVTGYPRRMKEWSRAHPERRLGPR